MLYCLQLNCKDFVICCILAWQGLCSELNSMYSFALRNIAVESLSSHMSSTVAFSILGSKNPAEKWKQWNKIIATMNQLWIKGQILISSRDARRRSLNETSQNSILLQFARFSRFSSKIMCSNKQKLVVPYTTLWNDHQAGKWDKIQAFPYKLLSGHYIFSRVILHMFFLIFARLWWLGVLGLGSCIGLSEWGFQLWGLLGCLGLGLSI